MVIRAPAIALLEICARTKYTNKVTSTQFAFHLELIGQDGYCPYSLEVIHLLKSRQIAYQLYKDLPQALPNVIRLDRRAYDTLHLISAIRQITCSTKLSYAMMHITVQFEMLPEPLIFKRFYLTPWKKPTSACIRKWLWKKLIESDAMRSERMSIKFVA